MLSTPLTAAVVLLVAELVTSSLRWIPKAGIEDFWAQIGAHVITGLDSRGWIHRWVDSDDSAICGHDRRDLRMSSAEDEAVGVLLLATEIVEAILLQTSK